MPKLLLAALLATGCIVLDRGVSDLEGAQEDCCAAHQDFGAIEDFEQGTISTFAADSTASMSIVDISSLLACGLAEHQHRAPGVAAKQLFVTLRDVPIDDCPNGIYPVDLGDGRYRSWDDVGDPTADIEAVGGSVRISDGSWSPCFYEVELVFPDGVVTHHEFSGPDLQWSFDQPTCART